MKKIFVLCFLVLILGCIRVVDCGTDLLCFKKISKECSPGKILLQHEGNKVLIMLRGMDKDNCVISVKVEEIGEKFKQKYPLESTELRGKTVNCWAPKKYGSYREEVSYFNEIINMSNNLDKMCRGQLKDILEGPLRNILVDEFNRLLSE